jgi:hypothetical protein
MARGFQFAEVMGGTYTLADAPVDNRRISFSIDVRANSLASHLRNGKAALRGTLDMDGFADHVAIAGTVTILPLTKKIIHYEFEFLGNDGQPYRFVGQKNIKFRDLRQSFTTLPATVQDARGHEVASCLTRFDLGADLFGFLASWRPA